MALLSKCQDAPTMTHHCLALLKYLEAATLPKEDKLDLNLDSQYLQQKHLPLLKGLTN